MASHSCGLARVVLGREELERVRPAAAREQLAQARVHGRRAGGQASRAVRDAMQAQGNRADPGTVGARRRGARHTLWAPGPQEETRVQPPAATSRTCAPACSTALDDHLDRPGARPGRARPATWSRCCRRDRRRSLAGGKRLRAGLLLLGLARRRRRRTATTIVHGRRRARDVPGRRAAARRRDGRQRHPARPARRAPPDWPPCTATTGWAGDADRFGDGRRDPRRRPVPGLEPTSCSAAAACRRRARRRPADVST